MVLGDRCWAAGVSTRGDCSAALLALGCDSRALSRCAGRGGCRRGAARGPLGAPREFSAVAAARRDALRRASRRPTWSVLVPGATGDQMVRRWATCSIASLLSQQRERGRRYVSRAATRLRRPRGWCCDGRTARRFRRRRHAGWGRGPGGVRRAATAASLLGWKLSGGTARSFAGHGGERLGRSCVRRESLGGGEGRRRSASLPWPRRRRPWCSASRPTGPISCWRSTVASPRCRSRPSSPR